MGEFVIHDGVVKSYEGPGGDVIVPAGATTIAGGFFLCRNMKTLVLPETVTVIEPAAFYVCENLTKITLPKSLQTIGKTAFVGCKNLSAITIPGGVKEIESRCFVNCGLESVVLEDGVQRIGDGAFMNCRQLRDVTIPASVKSIGYRAFFGCAIQNIRLSPRTTGFGSDVFEECDELQILQAPGVSPEKLQKQGLMIPAAMGYLCDPGYFAHSKHLAEYDKYIVSRKKHLVARLVKDDRVEGIQTYAQLGKITPANFENDFLQPALSAGATLCVAFLINWKNQHISPEVAAKQRNRDWKL